MWVTIRMGRKDQGVPDVNSTENALGVAIQNWRFLAEGGWVTLVSRHSDCLPQQKGQRAWPPISGPPS